MCHPEPAEGSPGWLTGYDCERSFDKLRMTEFFVSSLIVEDNLVPTQNDFPRISGIHAFEALFILGVVIAVGDDR